MVFVHIQTLQHQTEENRGNLFLGYCCFKSNWQPKVMTWIVKHSLPMDRNTGNSCITLTILSVITLRKSPKSIFPATGIIFWISSFSALSPRACMATCGTDTQHISCCRGAVIKVGITEWHLIQAILKKRTNHYPIHVYCSSFIRVKEIESLLHIFRLLLSQFDFDSHVFLYPLASRRSRFAVPRSLRNANIRTWLSLHTRYAASSWSRGTYSLYFLRFSQLLASMIETLTLPQET